mmetsp:Transcript_32564/g.76714  ORF Transcript_32564/g.76714 Transcript_32564/m.76714 type:complete len:232 (-) Transcript_32564:103-798(-)
MVRGQCSLFGNGSTHLLLFVPSFRSRLSSQFFVQLVAVGRIDPTIVVLDHFAFFKAEFFRVKLDGVVVRDLNVQRDLGDVLQVGRFRLVLVLLKIVQYRLNQLRSDCSSPISRQNSQRHDIDSFFVVGAVVTAVAATATAAAAAAVLDWFYSRGCRSDHKAVPVGKLAETVSRALGNIFVVFFLVLDGETRQVHLSQLLDVVLVDPSELYFQFSAHVEDSVTSDSRTLEFF